MDTDHFISADWGTSSLRLKLVHRSDGEIISSVSSDQGIKRTFFAWEKRGGDRQGFYLDILLASVKQLGEKSKVDCSALPMILSGMASSSLGMKELPYAGVPFDLGGDDLISTRIQIRPGQSLWLISGISTHNDVMRGEEVQVLGWYAQFPTNDSVTVIFPGTHCKHLFIEQGRIIDFKTYMTGELFDILSEHSILKNDLRSARFEDHQEAFAKGVEDVQQQSLTHLLFTIRGRVLQDQLSGEDARAYLSGLLVGSEFKDQNSGRIVLCAAAKFIAMYKKAIDVLGMDDVQVVPEADDHLAVEGHRWFLDRVGE